MVSSAVSQVLLSTALGCAHGVGSAGTSPGVTQELALDLLKCASLAHIAGGVPGLPPLAS